MAGGAPDVGEQLAAAPPVPSQLEGGGGCQQAHERVRQIALLLIDLRLGDGIEQAAPKHDRRGTHGARGGRRWKRLRIDPQRLLEGGRGVLLNDEAPLLDQRVAHPTLEGRRVHLDLVAAAALGRLLVALAAAGRVEEGTEPFLRGERAVEHHLAAREAVLLRAVEAAQRVAGFERPLAAGRDANQERHGGPATGAVHGARLFSSILSAMSPACVNRQSARTTSPGWRSPNAMEAPSPNTAVADCVRMCTTRTASPTPMMRSRAPALTARTVPWKVYGSSRCADNAAPGASRMAVSATARVRFLMRASRASYPAAF